MKNESPPGRATDCGVGRHMPATTPTRASTVRTSRCILPRCGVGWLTPAKTLAGASRRQDQKVYPAALRRPRGNARQNGSRSIPLSGPA
eukprot:15754377-Heterocapsa_arctica.AAC.1